MPGHGTHQLVVSSYEFVSTWDQLLHAPGSMPKPRSFSSPWRHRLGQCGPEEPNLFTHRRQHGGEEIRRDSFPFATAVLKWSAEYWQHDIPKIKIETSHLHIYFAPIPEDNMGVNRNVSSWGRSNIALFMLFYPKTFPILYHLGEGANL